MPRQISLMRLEYWYRHTTGPEQQLPSEANNDDLYLL